MSKNFNLCSANLCHLRIKVDFKCKMQKKKDVEEKEVTSRCQLISQIFHLNLKNGVQMEDSIFWLTLPFKGHMQEEFL